MIDLILGIFVGIIISLVVLIIASHIIYWVDTVDQRLKTLEQRLDKQNEINRMFKMKKEYKEE